MVGIPSGIGEVKRDLGAILQALRVVGGGGSPNELRSDAGIMVTVDVEETLSRHEDLVDQDIEISTAAPGALNTSTTNTFSFSEDHYIQGLDFFATINPANVDYMAVRLIPQGQAEALMLAFSFAANLVNFPGLPGADDLFPNQMTSVPFPLFVRAQTDYEFTVRSNGGGGCTGTVNILRSQAPQGVRIAH